MLRYFNSAARAADPSSRAEPRWLPGPGCGVLQRGRDPLYHFARKPPALALSSARAGSRAATGHATWTARRCKARHSRRARRAPQGTTTCWPTATATWCGTRRRGCRSAPAVCGERRLGAVQRIGLERPLLQLDRLVEAPERRSEARGLAHHEGAARRELQRAPRRLVGPLKVPAQAAQPPETRVGVRQAGSRASACSSARCWPARASSRARADRACSNSRMWTTASASHASA